MKFPWLLGVGLWALLASGCVQLPTECVAVGRGVAGRYVVTTELRACGIKRDAQDREHDYVLLVGRPGIANRFVVQLGTVPAGTELEVVGAVRTRLKAHAPEFVVRFAQRPAWGSNEARIWSARVSEFYVHEPGSGLVRLNPEIFRRVE